MLSEFDPLLYRKDPLPAPARILVLRLSRRVASNDFNLFARRWRDAPGTFLPASSLPRSGQQIFEWQLTRLHLLDNFLEPIHRAFKVQLRSRGFGLLLMGKTEE